MLHSQQWAFQVALVAKNLPANAVDVRDAGSEDPLEEDIASHPSLLAQGRKESDTTEQLALREVWLYSIWAISKFFLLRAKW